MPRTLLLPLVAALALAAAAPQVALAGQARVVGSTLVYTATHGQVNDVVAVCDRPKGVCWVMDGPRRSIRSYLDAVQGPGCTRTQSEDGFTRAECPAAGIKSIELDLGDGNDLIDDSAIAFFGAPVPVSIEGGSGNDEINGSHPAANTIEAGPGNDRVIASSVSGSHAHPGSGDAIDGGSGNDTIVVSGVAHRVVGGAGDDTIKGGPVRASLLGGPGDDRIIGGFAKDRVEGGAGDDRLLGGCHEDAVFGGPGNDRLAAEDEDDFVHVPSVLTDTCHDDPKSDLLDGGPGRDALFARSPVGLKTLVGGPGRDLMLSFGRAIFRARDGERDDVKCIYSNQRAIADRADRVAATCGHVSR
jgi:hypothetical protein